MTDNLTTIPPTLVHYTLAQGAYKESCDFWFCPAGIADYAHIPVGRHFGIVFSPYPYASLASQNEWRYIRFVKLKAGYSKEISSRELTAEEIAHFAAFIPAEREKATIRLAERKRKEEAEWEISDV